MRTKLLGVIGGLGPLATAHFYELLTTLQAVKSEQEHIDILIYSVSSTPDRTAFITGRSANDPAVSLRKAMQTLISAGAGVLAIPCVTAHYFYSQLTQAVNVPILHIAEETARNIHREGKRTAGLLATDGTVKSRLFHDILSRYGIETLTPSPEDQALLMDIIYRHVKQGQPADENVFIQLADGLRSRGAETVILGCTELSLIVKNLRARDGFTDALKVLAKASLLACGAEIKE